MSLSLLLERLSETPALAEELIADAVATARHAAASGKSEHLRQLAGLLMIQAQIEEDQASLANGADEARNFRTGSIRAQAEALALLDQAADAGDRLAETCLVMAGHAQIVPEAFATAGEIRRLAANPQDHRSIR
jgi:hypothetical protein